VPETSSGQIPLPERYAAVTASVAVSDVPTMPPPELEPFVEPVVVDGAVVSWRLAIGAIIAAGSNPAEAGPAMHAAQEFVMWQAQFVAQFSLGTLAECEAARPLCVAAGAASLAGLDFRVEVLDPAAAGRLEDDVRRAVTGLDDTDRAGWALHDITTGRLMRTAVVDELVSEVDGNSLRFEKDRGLVLRYQGREVLADGWKIHGEGLQVHYGSDHLEITGPFARRLQLLAPGAVGVHATPATALEACSPLLHGLAEASFTASANDRFLIIRTALARR
jgi:hypothetical protein